MADQPGLRPQRGQARSRPPRRGAWAAVVLVLGVALMMPALAAAQGPSPQLGAGELVWVYDEGVGRYGGWSWDADGRRWVLSRVRQVPPSGAPAAVPSGSIDASPAPSAPAEQSSPTEPSTPGRPLPGQPVGAEAGRPSFFVDCRGGDDNAAGTQAAPWRTPGSLGRRTLPARAVVYLKRGCTWDGQVRIAGDEIALAPYGEGDPPTITAKDAPREEGAVVVDSPRGVVAGLRIRYTAGAGIWLAAKGAAAVDSLVENVAFGVKFTAPHTIADRVAARDLHLYTSTPKSEQADDDSGAVGFNVESTDVTVQNSSCVNCRAPSDDYGHDGGFIEIWREGDRLRAFNNVGYNVDGFLEIGGMKGSGDAVEDVLLQGNKVSRVYERALYINQGGPYDIPVTRLIMRDNVMQLASGSAAAGDTSGVDIDDSNRIGREVPPPVATPAPSDPEQPARD